jgi:hypothetical protein
MQSLPQLLTNTKQWRQNMAGQQMALIPSHTKSWRRCSYFRIIIETRGDSREFGIFAFHGGEDSSRARLGCDGVRSPQTVGMFRGVYTGCVWFNDAVPKAMPEDQRWKQRKLRLFVYLFMMTWRNLPLSNNNVVLIISFIFCCYVERIVTVVWIIARMLLIIYNLCPG